MFSEHKAPLPALERTYGAVHRLAKRALGRSIAPAVEFRYTYSAEDAADLLATIKRSWPDGGHPPLNGSAELPDGPAGLFYGENGFDTRKLAGRNSTVKFRGSEKKFASADEAWRSLLTESIVPPGWRNSGLHTVCYLRHSSQWSLSNWIWTSAAIARYYASVGDGYNLLRIADALMTHQLSSGAWVVRFDYLSGGTTPIVAPNDSAYIASHALLGAYELTKEQRYIDAAEKCAAWIMNTAQPDGMVPFGYDQSTGRWVTEVNIVDVGFTAELFTHLYTLTNNSDYLNFGQRFASAYISKFRDQADGSFATSIRGDGRQFGGRFARGQAWALEGLIPIAMISEDTELEMVVDGIVDVLLESQRSDGSWAYNLEHRYSGADCKGIPVIAKSLATWGVARNNTRALDAAAHALTWAREHTKLEGEAAGGIFSYSVEGGVTHSFYKEAAFVYASSYALETSLMLGTHDDAGVNA